MKKIFCLLFTLVTLTVCSFRATAQDALFDAMDLMPDRSEKTFTFDESMYLGFGFHVVDGDNAFVDQTNFGKNREFFISVFSADFKPYRTGMLSLGVMLDWNRYRLNKDHYWLPVDGTTVSVVPAAPNFKSIKRSRLSVFSIDVPLDFTQRIGNLCVTVGAAAEFNFAGRTRFKGVSALDGTTVKNGNYRTKEIKTRPITYSGHAMLTWKGGPGLFVKYSPESKFQQDYGPQFTTWTFGIVL